MKCRIRRVLPVITILTVLGLSALHASAQTTPTPLVSADAWQRFVEAAGYSLLAPWYWPIWLWIAFTSH